MKGSIAMLAKSEPPDARSKLRGIIMVIALLAAAVIVTVLAIKVILNESPPPSVLEQLK